jgi:vacuolar-type H+-ATPase subunit E/Vma4
MSVDAIVRAVTDSAAAEADEIVEAATRHAEEHVAAARAAAAARVEEACARAEPGFKAAAMRRVNAARLRQLERRATRSAMLVDAAADAAESLLRGIAAEPDGERWQAALRRIAEETAAGIGGGGVLAVRPVDLDAARGHAARVGCEVAARDLAPGADVLDGAGVVGRSADGRVEVDARLAVRLARARVRLAEPVAGLLGMDD